MDEPGIYLEPTFFIDSDNPTVVDYARAAVEGAAGATEVAVQLFYAVRDDIRYDPYRISLDREELRASACLERGYGFCVPKAILLAAACRAMGVPARLGFADVRNHLATKRLLDLIRTDIFIYHGYTEILLDGRWVKATPAFNLTLCEKFGVLPLEFDGSGDAVFHPFDGEGRRHMEYVNDRGSFADLPYEEMTADFAALYPRWASEEGDFAAEAEAERV